MFRHSRLRGDYSASRTSRVRSHSFLPLRLQQSMGPTNPSYSPFFVRAGRYLTKTYKCWRCRRKCTGEPPVAIIRRVNLAPLQKPQNRRSLGYWGGDPTYVACDKLKCRELQQQTVLMVRDIALAQVHAVFVFIPHNSMLPGLARR